MGQFSVKISGATGSVLNGNQQSIASGRQLLTSVRLCRLTDIDAAVLDRTTGDLALFQLKWQDFRGATTRQTISRAKNFVGQVQKWAENTTTWIDLPPRLGPV
jgi:hypothetical protein